MKAVAIIQARVGSSRLPGKVLLRIGDKPILEYVVQRVRSASSIEDVVVATTTKEEDTVIAELAQSLNVKVYRGSENDVLDRYYQAVRLFNIKDVVRITADCPLIDPAIIDKVVQHYFESNADYCTNTLGETFPDGQDVEVFTADALADSWQNARLLSEREHVTSYMRIQTDKFKVVNVPNQVNLSDKRWTLDRPQDFPLIKEVLEAFYPKNPCFSMDDVLRFLKENPHLENINKDIKRNEGYSKSLEEDERLKEKGLGQ
ncbi:glycosyltransferase family protein [bacterium]|nr:glycosyltransferase family protein [bacterium]